MKQIIIVLLLVVVVGQIQARIFHVDPSTANYYPLYSDEHGTELMSSKDLDLTFSAGDPSKDNDIVYPIKKVNYVPEWPIYKVNRDIVEHPVYYRIPDLPVRKSSYEDSHVSPERSPGYGRLNPFHKGEVVLELRVIANNNNDN